MIRQLTALAAFLVLIGGLAWVLQNLPNWRAEDPIPAPAPPTTTVETHLGFENAIWDARAGAWIGRWDDLVDDLARPKEFEINTPAHYDFHVTNKIFHNLHLGLDQTLCDCARIEACAFPYDDWQKAKTESTSTWPWKPLKKDDASFVLLPNNGHAVVRVNWTGRKGEGDRLKLGTSIWVQVADKSKAKVYYSLLPTVVLVPPLQFLKRSTSLGVLGETNQAQFYAWSSTRKNPKVEVKLADPLVEVQVESLGEMEVDKLVADMAEKKMTTRVQSAFRIRVIVRERVGDLQLDQGYWSRNLPVEIDGLDQESISVTGVVRSDVDVGISEDQGKIQLKGFSAAEGVKKTIPLRSDAQTNLTIDSVEPAAIQVQIKPSPMASGDRKRWDLTVQVPGGTLFGDLAGHVILRSQNANAQNSQVRKIRIPLVGTAEQR